MLQNFDNMSNYAKSSCWLGKHKCGLLSFSYINIYSLSLTAIALTVKI